MSHGPGFPSEPFGPGSPAGPDTPKHVPLAPGAPAGALAPLLPVKSTKINKCASLCLCVSPQTFISICQFLQVQFLHFW